MRVLFLGDIFARAGRGAIAEWLPDFRKDSSVDFVIANAENAAGGKGITRDVIAELAGYGIDVFTGGNHSFAQRESLTVFDDDPRVLRPANLAPGIPGRGMGVYECAGKRIAVINLQGRAFMVPVDCPFRKADELLDEALRQTPIVFVDLHAEATSEKMAMAHYLDGRVTAVIGTHTHVPTCDARVTDRGTAAISDVGMCGPYDSVIGVETEIIMEQLIRGLPVRHKPASEDVRVCALLVDLDEVTGRARSVEQIIHPEFIKITE